MIKILKYQFQRWVWYRYLHLVYTGWRARHGGLPNWKSHLEHKELLKRQAREKSDECLERILIATGTAGHLPSMMLESLLGVTLSVRGAGVDFLLCDGALPACMMCEINWYSDVKTFSEQGPKDRCWNCHRLSATMLDDAAFIHVGLGSQVSQEEREQANKLAATVSYRAIHSFVINSIPIGEHAMAGALRFYARGDLDTEVEAEVVLRRYFKAALLTYYACKRLLATGRYSVVVLNHGIYVPQGIIAETARRMGVRVVTWHPAYRRGCFIFNHDETYHQGLLTEPVSSWKGIRWGAEHKKRIEQYLRSRWGGEQDWVRFHQNPDFNVEAIQKEIGIDLSRPTIGLLTNVVWDAQLHYQANAFSGMLDWLIKTIEYFKNRPELQLLIRIHPAEISGTLPSRQPAIDEIRHSFPQMPVNVFIIPPTSRLSTYVAMSQCNAVIIYGTKTGVELTATGIPVIVAGEAWIRGKDVTLDAESEENYFALLDTLPLSKRLDDSTRDRALKYAYHFFFRRMIPLECVKEKKGWPPFGINISGLSDLEPGSSLGLDVICEGILSGTPFIYPDEEILGCERSVKPT